MDSVFVWEEPPATAHDRFASKVHELETRPGKWARLEDGLTEKEAEDARRTLKSYWGCQVAVRKTNGAGRSLWARIRVESS